MRYTFTRDFYFPKNATKVTDKLSDAVAYIAEYTKYDPFTPAHKTRYQAVIFFGKQNKPVANYTYTKVAARDKAVAEAFESRRKSMSFKKELRDKRKNWVNDYKVGDLLHTSWGYDQTNVEFFEVVEVRGKMVWVREVAQKVTQTGFESGECEPIPGKYVGEPLRRLAQETGVKIDNVRSAFRGGGKQRWSSYH